MVNVPNDEDEHGGTAELPQIRICLPVSVRLSVSLCDCRKSCERYNVCERQTPAEEHVCLFENMWFSTVSLLFHLLFINPGFCSFCMFLSVWADYVWLECASVTGNVKCRHQPCSCRPAHDRQAYLERLLMHTNCSLAASFSLVSYSSFVPDFPDAVAAVERDDCFTFLIFYQ